jgi:hypothetical protein
MTWQNKDKRVTKVTTLKLRATPAQRTSEKHRLASDPLRQLAKVHRATPEKRAPQECCRQLHAVAYALAELCNHFLDGNFLFLR